MTIKTGVEAGWILFEKWQVKSGSQLFFAMLFVLLLALLTEGISFVIWLLQYQQSANKDAKNVPSKFISPALYCLMRLLNYSQMLIVMTYNLWLIFSIAAFQAIANFLFNSIKDKRLLNESHRINV